MIKVTDEMIDAFGGAWELADAQSPLERGVRRRAGLEAVIKVIERDYQVEPRRRPGLIVNELVDGIWYSCHPIGCDYGYHLQGCVFAERDGAS